MFTFTAILLIIVNARSIVPQSTKTKRLRRFSSENNVYEYIRQVDIGDYMESNEWEIIEHPAKKNTRYKSCCREPHPYLTFFIKIKRVAVFYNYILVFPCLLLSFITLVIFWLPPESPAKMILGNIAIPVYALYNILMKKKLQQFTFTTPWDDDSKIAEQKQQISQKMILLVQHIASMLRSNIIFCDICCFSSAILVPSSL